MLLLGYGTLVLKWHCFYLDIVLRHLNGMLQLVHGALGLEWYALACTWSFPAYLACFSLYMVLWHLNGMF